MITLILIFIAVLLLLLFVPLIFTSIAVISKRLALAVLVLFLFWISPVFAGCNSTSDYYKVVDEFTDEETITHTYDRYVISSGFLGSTSIEFRNNYDYAPVYGYQWTEDHKKGLFVAISLGPIFFDKDDDIPDSLYEIIPADNPPKSMPVMFRIDGGKVRTFEMPLETNWIAESPTELDGIPYRTGRFVLRNKVDIQEFLSYINTANSKIAIRVDGIEDHIIEVSSRCYVSPLTFKENA
ncbi:hypothetical protein N9N08_01000 [bacterium]|nr:hypothetical protein [bacterium]